MRALFDPEKIVSHEVPEFFVHGPRRMELLDGNVVQIWLCRDMPVAIEGITPMSMPVVRLTVPVRAFVWNNLASAQWGFDHGLLQQKPMGPCELRPQRRLLM